MPTDNAAFVGSIPENYDRCLGPVLFDPYAADLVARLDGVKPASILELACGTGIVSRRLRDRFDASVKIVATDLNEAMMSYAAQKFRPEDNIEWKQADATELPFADQSFDAVVCQFGLMFFPDKVKSASEAQRVLKPGGIFIFNVWDAIEHNDLPNIAHSVIKKFFENNPPDFYDIPFSYHEPETIRSLLSGAGFRDIQLTVLPTMGTSPSARDVAKGLVHGNPIITAIRERDESRLPEIETAVEAGVIATCGDAPVRARMQALVCSAIR
jgi:ubiquinone/menaquinone biosynthesis C-methylase UbiE